MTCSKTKQQAQYPRSVVLSGSVAAFHNLTVQFERSSFELGKRGHRFRLEFATQSFLLRASSSTHRRIWNNKGSGNAIHHYRSNSRTASSGTHTRKQRAPSVTIPNDLAVTGSNRDPATCLLGSETGLPLRQRKNHCPRAAVIAVATPKHVMSCDTDYELGISLVSPRATRAAPRRASPRPAFDAKVSIISESLARRVNGCWHRCSGCVDFQER